MPNGFALVQRAPCAKMHSKILRLNMLECFPINTASTQYSWLLSQVRNSEFSHKQWNKLYKQKPRKPRNKNSDMAWGKKIKFPHMLLAHHTEPLRLTQELFFSKAHGPSFHSQFYFLTMWPRDMKKLARWDMSAPLEELEEAGTGGAKERILVWVWLSSFLSLLLSILPLSLGCTFWVCFGLQDGEVK